MGLFKTLLKKGIHEVDKHLNKTDGGGGGGGGGGGQHPPSSPSAGAQPPTPSGSSSSAASTPAPTRWERTVFCLRGVISRVSEIDRDGVDVVFVPGRGGSPSAHHGGVRDARDLERAIEAAGSPGGRCVMAGAIEAVLDEAFERGFESRPTCVLVLTAGRPDDHEEVTSALADATRRAALEEGGAENLTVTFVQVGDDAWAGEYLRHLDEGLGGDVDIVDTVKGEEILEAVNEQKEAHDEAQGSGAAGALFGAFAGAALGAGGAYLANKLNASKRTKGWGGTWRCTSDKTGEEIATLEVTDDQNGNLVVAGWDHGKEARGTYADDGDGGLNVQFSFPDSTGGAVVGAVEDEHTIAWDDGTRWEEISPDGLGWGKMAGAAAAGAAGGGGLGYLLDKKFFHKASGKEPADYVVVVDRSRMMGRNPPRGPPPLGKAGGTKTGGAAGAGDAIGGLTHRDAKYEDLTWAEIPAAAWSALETLGYDRDSWDEDEWNDICEYWWEDFSSGQRRALETLGWEEAAWDSRYEEHGWDDLPGPVRKAAEVLGFEKWMWDDDEWPDATDKYWDDFTNEERRALHVLGYYRYSWDG